jgi:hypothetical protein
MCAGFRYASGNRCRTAGSNRPPAAGDHVALSVRVVVVGGEKPAPRAGQTRGPEEGFTMPDLPAGTRMENAGAAVHRAGVGFVSVYGIEIGNDHSARMTRGII